MNETEEKTAREHQQKCLPVAAKIILGIAVTAIVIGGAYIQAKTGIIGGVGCH